MVFEMGGMVDVVGKSVGDWEGTTSEEPFFVSGDGTDANEQGERRWM